MMGRSSGTYRINGKMFRLDTEIYHLVKNYGITSKDIQNEYWKMKSVTPGLRIVTHNHAAYSAFLRKMKRGNTQ